MRLTKYSHACVRLERDGAVLVIDPGTLSERAALDGVDAVLVTHEHFDHLDVEALTEAREKRPRPADLHPPRGDAEARRPGRGGHRGAAGRRLRGGRLRRAHLRRAARGDPSRPAADLQRRLLHRGRVPPRRLVRRAHRRRGGDAARAGVARRGRSSPRRWSSCGRWRRAGPTRIHDGLLNDVGLKVFDTMIGNLSGRDYVRLGAGEAVEL